MHLQCADGEVDVEHAKRLCMSTPSVIVVKRSNVAPRAGPPCTLPSTSLVSVRPNVTPNLPSQRPHAVNVAKQVLTCPCAVRLIGWLRANIEICFGGFRRGLDSACGDCRRRGKRGTSESGTERSAAHRHARASCERQEVVSGSVESRHQRDASNALMLAMPVVLMDPTLDQSAHRDLNHWDRLLIAICRRSTADSETTGGRDVRYDDGCTAGRTSEGRYLADAGNGRPTRPFCPRISRGFCRKRETGGHKNAPPQ